VLAVLAAAVVAIRPWGDHPINDDWQYARIVQRLAATGVYETDVPIAPSLVGQVLLTLPFVAIGGFSHTLLRMLTLAMACLLLLILNRLLTIAGVGGPIRLVGLACIAFNPLFLYFSLSYMTEIWGTAISLGGALCWFEARGRQLAGGSRGWLPPPAVVVAATALAASAFWIRQLTAVVVPALVLAAVLAALARRPEVEVRARLGSLVLAAATSAAVVAAYFAWAAATGNLRPAFTAPLAGMLLPRPGFYLLHPGVFLLYMTGFLAALLVLVPAAAARLRSAGSWLAGGCLLGVVALALWQVSLHGKPDVPLQPLHAEFPYLKNVLHKSGIGPITLADVYISGRPFVLSEGLTAVWRGVEWTLVALAVLWVPFASGLGAAIRASASPVARELLLFGLLLALGSFLLVGQAFGVAAFDRYYFQSWLGLALAVPIVVQHWSRTETRAASRLRFAGSAALLAPLAFYTVAGLHDHFRWQDARWEHVRALQEEGVPALNVAGGFEVEGWAGAYDAHVARDFGAARCAGECRCTWPNRWWCHDDTYRIAMNPLRGYRIAAEIQPDYWLWKSPPVYRLERRPVAPARGPE